MKSEDFPAFIISSGVKRRDDAELAMVGAGMPFEEITDNLTTMRELDERIATAIRDRLSQLRGLPPDEIVTALAQAADAAFDRYFA